MREALETKELAGEGVQGSGETRLALDVVLQWRARNEQLGRSRKRTKRLV